MFLFIKHELELHVESPGSGHVGQPPHQMVAYWVSRSPYSTSRTPRHFPPRWALAPQHLSWPLSTVCLAELGDVPTWIICRDPIWFVNGLPASRMPPPPLRYPILTPKKYLNISESFWIQVALVTPITRPLVVAPWVSESQQFHAVGFARGEQCIRVTRDNGRDLRLVTSVREEALPCSTLSWPPTAINITTFMKLLCAKSL